MVNKYTTQGFGVVEIIVAISIISLTVVGLFNATVVSFQTISDNTKRIQATFLLEETIEVLKVLRDQSWAVRIATVSTNTDQFLTFNGTQWRTTNDNIFIDDIFERKFQITDVYRDSNDDIVSSGGTLDSNTKKVTSSVAWASRSGTTTISASTYITNLSSN